jgi:RNA polymerase sigma-70 factor (ECF subfamily)
MQQTDEQRLITRILNGHTEDYSYFMERYGENVFRLVAKLVTTQEDAEELVQDAFVRAYNHLSDFTGEASFSTWIYRIAYNLTVSWLRKQKMKYLQLDEKMDVSDKDIDQLLDDISRIEQLHHACAKLSPDEQTLINLFYYEDLPMHDIAYVLGLGSGNVATRLHRIRKKLYIIIKRMEQHELSR